MPARVMAALVLAGCELTLSGLSPNAPAGDAGVAGRDASASRDASALLDASAPPDASAPRDTGVPDAASDAGHDAGADAATPALDAAVDATLPALDAAVDAAPPPSCEELFGSASGYLLCWEDPVLCAFNADTAGGNCAGICAGLGVACLGAVDNWSGCDPTGNDTDTCDTNRSSEICLCERPAQ